MTQHHLASLVAQGPEVSASPQVDTPLLCQHKDRPQHSSNTEENRVTRTDLAYARDLKVICSEERGWVGGQSRSSTFRKALGRAGYMSLLP